MADWGPLLDHLASGPREDGTPELAATARWLVEELARRGLTAERFEWVAHPWRLRTVGVVALLAALGYCAALIRHGRKPTPLAMTGSPPRAQPSWVAVAITLAVPAYLVAELDFGIPLLGRLHSVPQENLIATIAPLEAPERRLIFSAHYDTKTDLLDHVVRSPITALGVPFTLVMLIGAFIKRLKHVALGCALFNGIGLFLVQTGGAFVPHRSPGAVDDGASCAVLLELASTFRENPLAHTEVKLVFFSGEEIGLEGAHAWVDKGLDRSLPVQVLNLDGIGASPRLTLYSKETGLVRSYAPDEDLARRVDDISRLHRPWYPATTDARVFLAAGIPALNLSSERPDGALPRHMHSKSDARSTVDLAALDQAVGVLTEVARRLDSGAR